MGLQQWRTQTSEQAGVVVRKGVPFDLKEMKALSRKAICNPMSISAPLTKAKVWKQAKCPLMDEWILKM